MNTPRDTKGSSVPNWAYLAALGLALLAYLMYAAQLAGPPAGVAYEVLYSDFKQLVDRGQVAEVTLHGSRVEGLLREPASIGPAGQRGTRFKTRIPAFGDPDLLATLEQKRIAIRVEAAEEAASWGSVLLATLPWLLVWGLLFWALYRAYRTLPGGLGGRADLQTFLRSPTRKAEVPEVRFDDVAGQDNAKREVQELVDYLRTPEPYERLGAEVPRGVLLMGAPGTGKTLLARALAGEAGVPFFSISASEFIEMFVGVGAARVRHLFETAKKEAPAIIFIDELDAVGRTRGTGLGGGHDEREQTLNQVLAEMDGFAGHERVIVLAATNRPDVLDPALLRPGRFDRHVTLDLPDRKERRAILDVHTRDVPLADDVNLDALAAGTPGFSGADLKNLVNEAALRAARHRSERAARCHFEDARDRVLLGTERTLAIQPEERHRLAVHEAGHTVVAYFARNADPLHKVTIIPRGRALGGTQQLPEVERYTLPEEYLRDRLTITLGGRVAERELLGSLSSGADDDIQQVSRLARAMVTRWGMSEEIGPVDLRDSEEHPFLGREMAKPRHVSESSAQAVDRAVRHLVLRAEETATNVVRKHRAGIDKLIAALEDEETLGRDRIADCLGPRQPS